MHLLLKTLPVLTALIAAPSLAAEPKTHADHQPPAATAKPDAKAAQTPGCPMMSGQMAMNHGGKGPPQTMPHGKAGAGTGPMMNGDMHCMQASGAAPQTTPPPAGAAPEHDHDHPAK